MPDKPIMLSAKERYSAGVLKYKQMGFIEDPTIESLEELPELSHEQSWYNKEGKKSNIHLTFYSE